MDPILLQLLLLLLVHLGEGAPTNSTLKSHELGGRVVSRHKPNPEEMKGMFEGDIDLSDEEQKQLLDNSRIAFSTVTAERTMWDTGNIPYEFSSDFGFDEREIVEGAIEEIEEKTCVRFEERESQEDYILFADGPGCSSKVGKRGGEQVITLSHEGCVFHGTVIHEIVHSLGFWHEQSRTDRDQYVEIKWDNIQPDKYKNFRKYVSTESYDYQTAYDYGSVMHYKADAFQRDDTDEDTIVPKEDGVEIGQRRELSTLDAEKINRMYCRKGSDGKIKQKPVVVATTTDKEDDEYEENDLY